MPCELLKAALECSFILLCIGLIGLHDTLEQILGILQFADLLHQIGTNIEQELIVAVRHKTLGQILLNLGAETGFVLNCILTEYAVKHLLVKLALYKAGDILDSE